MARETITLKIIKWFVVVTVIVGMVFFFGSFLIFQGPLEAPPTPEEQFKEQMEKISFKTQDGVRIVGSYLPAQGEQVILLLHMMPSTKESWAPFMAKLGKAGFSSLAVDLRGHGESVDADFSAAPLNYQKFTDEEHQASKFDVDASVNFLREKGFGDENIVVVGASVGANLALDYIGRNSKTKAAVAISAGLDYRGISSEGAVKNLGPEQAVFLAAAEGDTYAFQSTNSLAEDIRNKELKIFPGADHGTNLFSAQPALMDEITGWLLDIYKE